MDAFSQSPTMLSSGPVPPDAGVPGENYGLAYPNQSMPPAAPYPWPGAPSSTVPPGPILPLAPGGFSPLPSTTPPRKSRSGLIIGILLALIVVLAGGLGVSLYALNTHNQQGQAGVGTATPAASPTSFPTPTSNETIILQDPLTSNTNGWANDADKSHCFFQDNSYYVRDNYVCYTPTANIADEAISVQVKQVAGSALYPYGIVFRREGPVTWYEFDIDSNGKWAIFKAANGAVTPLVNFTANAAIKRGLNMTNTLMVQFKGARFTFFINGTQVGTAQDATFSYGGSGLSAGADVEAAFNNLLITTVS
jgi:hypothetical protein